MLGLNLLIKLTPLSNTNSSFPSTSHLIIDFPILFFSTNESNEINVQFFKDFLTPKCFECFFSSEFSSQLV